RNAKRHSGASFMVSSRAVTAAGPSVIRALAIHCAGPEFADPRPLIPCCPWNTSICAAARSCCSKTPASCCTKARAWAWW
ncbi:MAG TPA: hypothetical protein DCE35_05260, partial [Alcanivorax sp.]|nr:hypothetical protein [Alcanivorax sp.]